MNTFTSKFLSGLLIVGALSAPLFVSAEPPAGYENEIKVKTPFTDVTGTSLEDEAAIELYERGIIGGYPDGEFKAYKEVNRAEAAKFLLLARYNKIEETMNNGKFPDVLDNQWYTKYVVTAANKGIINGYPSGYFHPGRTVNTAEFLKMLNQTFELEKDLPHTYQDVPFNAWFAPYAGSAHHYKLFPYATEYLKPEKNLTRGDVAIAIYQILINTKAEPEGLGETTSKVFSKYIDDDPMLGEPDAPITIVEFTDYQCPFCQRYTQNTFPSLEETYIAKGLVRYVLRDYPLSFHQQAHTAAVATNCAREQGKFWAMKEMLFEDSNWHNDKKEFTNYATKLRLNTSDFETCMTSGKYDQEIQNDINQGSEYGVTGTPAFFINEVPLMGAQPYESFVKVIEAELDRLNIKR